MATGITSTRYPDFKPQDIGNSNEMSKKLSELVRALDDKDKRSPNPYDVYGRTMTVDSSNLVYDGSSGGVEIYTITIPSDVGTIFLNYPDVATKERIVVYLPNSRNVEGRTISITARAASVTTPELSVATAPGSGNEFVLPPPFGRFISGTITTTTHFSPAGGMPSGLPLYAYIAANTFGAGVPSGNTIVPVGTFDSSTSVWYGPVSDTFVSTTDASNAYITLGGTSVSFVFQVRAYFNNWLILSTV